MIRIIYVVSLKVKHLKVRVRSKRPRLGFNIKGQILFW